MQKELACKSMQKKKKEESISEFLPRVLQFQGTMSEQNNTNPGNEYL